MKIILNHTHHCVKCKTIHMGILLSSASLRLETGGRLELPWHPSVLTLISDWCGPTIKRSCLIIMRNQCHHRSRTSSSPCNIALLALQHHPHPRQPTSRNPCRKRATPCRWHRRFDIVSRSHCSQDISLGFRHNKDTRHLTNDLCIHRNSYQCISSNCPTCPCEKSACRTDHCRKQIMVNGTHHQCGDASQSEESCKECQEDAACNSYNLASQFVQLFHIDLYWFVKERQGEKCPKKTPCRYARKDAPSGFHLRSLGCAIGSLG